MCQYIYIQGWEFAISIFALLLLLIFKNEWLWMICSYRSFKIKCEQIPLIALYKRAPMSKKERRQWFTPDMSESLSKKWEICSKQHIFSLFLTVFPPFYAKKVNRSCRFSLFFKDWQDQFALLALYKRGTVSKPFLLIFKKEQPWANLSHQSLKKSDRMIGFFPRSNFFFFFFSNWSFAHSITKKRAIRL